jgi:methylmalonyl-CoA/ethylmalonyl-CoA epimerase
MSTAPTIDHIGIIVENLEEAMASMEKFLGVSSGSIEEMPNVGIRLAPFKAANITIELIEYLSEEESFGRSTMSNQLGLNHISKQVDDIDGAMEKLAADGFDILPGFPVDGASGQVAFFGPDPASSVLLEICQHRKRENE